MFGGYGLTEFNLNKDCRSFNGECEYNLWDESTERRLRVSDETYQKIFLQPYFVFFNSEVTLNLGFKGTWVYYPEFNVIDSLFQIDIYELNETFLVTREYNQINGEAISLQPYLSFYLGHGEWHGIFSASYKWITYTNINRNYLLAPQYEFSIGIYRKFALQKKGKGYHGHYQ